jgi:phosphatidylinositol glycan class M
MFIGLYYILKRQYVLGGFFYGLSVHFKIYPIIYCIPLYLYIDCDQKRITAGKRYEAFKMALISKNKIIFTIISATTFLGFTYAFYVKYGYECLYESLLYHFERKDHRHNFSIYFYMIYELFEDKTSSVLAILTFLPQWGLVLIAGLTLYFDLFLVMFVQTTVFVMFNKVITAQYFLWYVTLLPMVLVNNKLTNTKKYIGMALTLGFVLFDANWNRASYRFEFAGEHAFKDIQLANYLWFWYTLVALYFVVDNY